MPKYIVHRVDVDGLTVTLTDVTDSVIVNEIDNAPSVVPSRAEGEWINHISDLFPAESTIECSVCHEEQPLGIDDNYCPNCGAKMKKTEGHKKVCTMNFQGPWCNECPQFWNCDILTGKAKEQVIEE